MKLRNTPSDYGLVARAFHWVTALAVFGLFGLGLWMTSLTYYDSWYRLGPWWHKGIGITLFVLIVARLVWRRFSPPPAPIESHKPYERIAAHLVHGLLYLLLFAVMLSGYLISTADGRPIPYFDLFEIAALPWAIKDQEDIAGTILLWLASSLVGVAILHALAAIKHHFVDRDRTLSRMLGRSQNH